MHQRGLADILHKITYALELVKDGVVPNPKQLFIFADMSHTHSMARANPNKSE